MRSRLTTVLVVLLVLVDVILVFFALRRPGAATATTPGTQTVRTAPSDTSSSPSATRTSASPGATGPTPVQSVIAAVDRKVAWRATVGTCREGGAELEVTTDGGRTWTAVEAPVGAVVRAQPLDADNGFVIGADAACELAQYSTQDAGQTWGESQPVDGGWARNLAATHEVTTPRQPAARPCGDDDVIDLSRSSAEIAEALCADGDVKVTRDGGTTWSDSGSAPGGVALGNRLEGGVLSTYVVRVRSACEGAEVVKVVLGEQPQVVSCVPVAGAPEPGQVGISTVAAGGWLWVGDEVWTAPAALANWSRT